MKPSCNKIAVNRNHWEDHLFLMGIDRELARQMFDRMTVRAKVRFVEKWYGPESE